MKMWAVGLVVSVVIQARSDTVMVRTVSESFGARDVFDTATAYFGTGLDYIDPRHLLFTGSPFGVQDIGRTFAISSMADDTNFDSVVSILTNGRDDFIFAALLGGYGMGGAQGAYESELFAGVARSGPDLAGFQIQSFTMTVNDIFFDTRGHNPNGDCIWTDMHGAVIYRIEAAVVPEPSTLLLLVLGANLVGVVACWCPLGKIGYDLTSEVIRQRIF